MGILISVVFWVYLIVRSIISCSSLDKESSSAIVNKLLLIFILFLIDSVDLCSNFFKKKP